MDNSRITFFLIVCIGILTYFLIPAPSAWFSKKTAAATTETAAIDSANDSLSMDIETLPALSREEKAARQALRDLPLEEGSIGDKVLNFLLSGKRDFYREVYEVKHNEFKSNGTPTTNLQTELTQLSEIMKAYPTLRIEVVCHTGQALEWQAQQELTQNRAQQIHLFLVDTGIDELRINATGYGAASPIADNTSQRGREMNERTEILIKGL